MLNAILQHYKSGTLWRAVKRRVWRDVKRNFQRTDQGQFYRNPTGDLYYGEVARKYVDKRSSQERWRHEEDVMRQLLADVPDGASVLDVPFGTGRFVPLYLKKKMAVYGLDASDDMVAEARRLLGEDFSQCSVRIGDGVHLPYPDNSYDVLVSFRFLANIISFGDAKRALSEFSRVTRRQAILQLFERDDSSPRHRFPKDEETMDVWLYPREIQQLLETAGFHMVKKSLISSDEAGEAATAHLYAFLCETVSS